MNPPSTPGWTLSNIRQKVRLITGRPSTDQLSDAQVNTYINDYYVYQMPFELKEQIQNQFLTFITTPGVDIYAFPGGYFTDSPGAYADGFPLVFYQDPDIFFQDWPQQYAVDNIAVGNGSQVTFTGGLQNPPVVIGSLLIASDDATGVQYIATDEVSALTNIFPIGNLAAPVGASYSASGTINYLTGAYSVTFSAAPSSTAVLYAKYQGYQGNRPQGVLFFNNQFTFRSVPDQAYNILMQGFVVPTLLDDTINTTPMQQEWGNVIAYGAALEIFSDSGDLENYDRYWQIFKRAENIALGRTIQQYTAEQSVPRF